MTTQATKPHIVCRSGYWSVYLQGKLVSSWPTLEAAWLRFKENYK